MVDSYIAVSGRLALELEGEVRIVSASQLNKSGVFTTHLGRVVEINLGGILVLAQCMAVELGVALWLPDQRAARLFRLQTSLTPFGIRYRFICLISGKQVDKVYLHERRFATRRECGFQIIPSERFGRSRRDLVLAKCFTDLLGQGGKGPARGANRKRLRAKAIRLLGSEEALDERLALGGYNPREFRKRRSSDPDAMSTLFAIARAAYTSPTYIYAGARKAVEDYKRDGPPPLAGGVLDADIEDIGGFPRLSIDTLFAKWREQSAPLDGQDSADGEAEGEPLTLVLRWETPNLEQVCLYGIGLERDPVLFISFGLTPDAGKLVLPLEYGNQANPKLYALCPVAGKRVSNLYWRQGRFASAEAQRLRRPSEMARRRKEP